MKPSLWNRWWLWAAIVVAIVGIAGVTARLLWPAWGSQFSANLFADLAIAVAVGMVIAGWLERTRKAKERGERTTKVLAALDKELRSNLEWVSKYLDVLNRKGGPIEDELRVAGWRAVAAGPLLDAVPEGLLSYLLEAYSLAEDVKGTLRLHLDLLLQYRADPSPAITNQLQDVRALLRKRLNDLKPLIEEALNFIEPYVRA